MKAKVFMEFEITDENLARLMKDEGYPDDFEPIHVKEVLKNVNEEFLTEYAWLFMENRVEVED